MNLLERSHHQLHHHLLLGPNKTLMQNLELETVVTDESASAECDARLLVDWGELPQVGRHARPLFSLIATAGAGRPSVRIHIDRSLDSDPDDPLRQPQLEEDGLWTFTVPFSLTSDGVDAKPGLYIIEVEVTFPHTALRSLAPAPWERRARSGKCRAASARTRA